jgi:acyl-CoA reductase-like NAD-dependent aldehyde dehydrogenase
MSEGPNTVTITHRIGGKRVQGSSPFESMDPYRGAVVARAPSGSAAEVDLAVQTARKAAKDAAAMPAYRRAEILRKLSVLLLERADAIGETMARETGKAIKDARGEVRRSFDTITLSAEEAIRIEGSHIPLDGSEMGAGKMAFMMRFPVGVVAAITPYNAPFNLACHKLAPAFAAGNAVVLKPPQQCPLVLDHLAQLFYDAGLPENILSVVHGGAETGRALVRHPDIDFVTFTGSSRVGAEIKAQSGLKRVALELGGNGPTVICADADIAKAAPLCARNAVRLAGQSCISVQNIYVDARIFEPFTAAVAREMALMKLGDPLDEATDVGTMIDDSAASRVESWVREAEALGARALVGGKRDGAAFEPTLLTNVKREMKVVCDEVFGPVANIIPFTAIEEAIEAVNASPYGLQCGVMTDSTATALRLFREIRTGGLIVNGTSTWRTDQLAYGGVKDSGIGREGPRYAIRDMTEERLILFNS